MPNDPDIWILLIVLTAFIVGLALFLGRGLIIRKDKKGFSIEVEKKKESKPKEIVEDSKISVGERAHLIRVKVGRIFGLRNSTQEKILESGNVEVLKEGELRDVDVDEIGGVIKERQGKESERKS